MGRSGDDGGGEVMWCKFDPVAEINSWPTRSLEGYGAYSILRDLACSMDGLPANPNDASKISGLTVEAVMSVWSHLVGRCDEREGKLLPKMLIEAKVAYEKKKETAKEAAQRRWQEQREKEADLAKRTAELEQMYTSSIRDVQQTHTSSMPDVCQTYTSTIDDVCQPHSSSIRDVCVSYADKDLDLDLETKKERKAHAQSNPFDSFEALEVESVPLSAKAEQKAFQARARARPQSQTNSKHAYANCYAYSQVTNSGKRIEDITRLAGWMHKTGERDEQIDVWLREKDVKPAPSAPRKSACPLNRCDGSTFIFFKDGKPINPPIPCECQGDA